MKIFTDELYNIVARDNLAKLQEAKETGINIYEVDQYRRSLLDIAVLNSAFQVTEYLIKQGLTVNTNSDFQSLPLHTACTVSNIKMVKLLLKYGADIHLKDNKGNTVLHYAVEGLGRTGWQIELIKYFVEELKFFIDIPNFEGNTPLFLSNSKLIPYLIEKGANIKLTNKQGDTPWLYLAKNYFDHFDFRKELQKKVEYLLEYGSDINSQDGKNQTALHYAVQCNYIDIVSLLLAKGAKSLKNEEGKIPVECTSNNKIKSLLRK